MFLYRVVSQPWVAKEGKQHRALEKTKSNTDVQIMNYNKPSQSNVRKIGVIKDAYFERSINT